MQFDFVIVGAGSAGCVLANRLTESGKYSVLLLEAGGTDKRFWIQTPIGYGKTFFDPAVNWMYTTEPVKGLNGQTSYWPRGKVIGGSSSINAMVYIRGQHQDFDDWAKLGNSGWGWQDVLPFFRKSETNANGGDEYRGDSGPLYVDDVSKNYHPICKTFIQAAEQVGLPYNQDFNGAHQEGAGMYQITARNGFRMSAAKAYLRPARKRKNLTVISSAHVTRISFSDTQAQGIEFLHQGKIKHAHANLETIISAGSINTPQLLQLSGIGDRETLDQFKIQMVLDQPSVGQNLQEHIAVSHFYKSKVPTLNNQLAPWWGKLAAGIQYLLLRNGPLSLSVNQAGGFFKSSPERKRPNLQLYFCPVTYTTAPDDERPLIQPDSFPGFLNSISQCRPTSTGYLKIRSEDPFTAPEIQPNYLSTEEDVQEMLEGVKFLRKMAQTPALQSIIESETKPGLEVSTDEELIEDFRNRSGTVYHPTSTCRMGSSASTSVVDNRLKIHGLQNIRIVDASVFPTVTSGNTNAPVIMLAEKASDLILQDQK